MMFEVESGLAARSKV